MSTLAERAERFRRRPAAVACRWGLRLCRLLALALIVARCAHCIATPWRIVLAPCWMPIALPFTVPVAWYLLRVVANVLVPR